MPQPSLDAGCPVRRRQPRLQTHRPLGRETRQWGGCPVGPGAAGPGGEPQGHVGGTGGCRPAGGPPRLGASGCPEQGGRERHHSPGNHASGGAVCSQSESGKNWSHIVREKKNRRDSPRAPWAWAWAGPSRQAAELGLEPQASDSPAGASDRCLGRPQGHTCRVFTHSLSQDVHSSWNQEGGCSRGCSLPLWGGRTASLGRWR